MSGNRVAERLQVIAAFEQGDDTAAGATVGQIHDLLRGPDEIGLGEVDVGEGVAHMRVKAGRDDHKLRPKFPKSRQILVSNAARNAAPPSPGRNGALTIVLCSPVSPTAPVPGNNGI